MAAGIELGGWLPKAVVDPSTGLLFVTNTHPGGTRGGVIVVDSSSGTVIGSVATPRLSQEASTWDARQKASTWDVAAGPIPGEVYVSYPWAGQVGVIDAATRQEVATINVGESPSALAVDPAARAVYAFSPLAGTVSVIDAATRQVLATIRVADREVTGLFSFDAGGLAVDPATGDIYVANGYADTVSVIDRDSRAVIDTITGLHDPWGVAIDPTGGAVYVTNHGNGTVSVIDSTTHKIRDTIKVVGSLGGIATDPTVHAMYVVDAGRLVVIDTRTRTVIDTLYAGAAEIGIALDPSTGTVYLPNTDWGTVSVLTAP